MEKEELIQLGIEASIADKVLALHKTSLDGKFIPKHRFDEVNSELAQSKEQVKERDGQIKALKKFEGNAEELSAKITELEKANKEKLDEYNSSISLERKKNSVRLALLEDAEGKPHDVEMVLSLLALDDIQIDDAGKITKGLKEQKEILAKEKSFLFSSPAPTPEAPKAPEGWAPRGSTPQDGRGDKPTDNASVSFGKMLASNKLNMMGIKPENKLT